MTAAFNSSIQAPDNLSASMEEVQFPQARALSAEGSAAREYCKAEEVVDLQAGLER